MREMISSVKTLLGGPIERSDTTDFFRPSCAYQSINPTKVTASDGMYSHGHDALKISFSYEIYRCTRLPLGVDIRWSLVQKKQPSRMEIVHCLWG